MMREGKKPALDEETAYWKQEAERLELLIGTAKIIRKNLEATEQ
jgi:hypothetical protein